MTYRPRTPKSKQRARTKAFGYRDAIADRYNQGLTDTEIAQEIGGLSVAEVTREREDMGLVVAATAGIIWSPEADIRIMDMRVRGFFWESIARSLPGFPEGKPPSGVHVRYRHDYLQRLGLRRTVNGGKSERACMTCGQPFPSEGKHNRMCDPCREGAGVDSHCVITGVRTGAGVRR